MTLRSAESLESAESSGERWGRPGAAAPVAEECREAEQLAAAMEELRRAAFDRLRKLISAAACSEFPTAGVVRAASPCLALPAAEQRGAAGRAPAASGAAAGSAAPLSAPQDAAGTFVHVYAYMGK
ncbi:suppressor of cytokine signaling 2 isoform 2-T2 [Passerculus sandwichensis]